MSEILPVPESISYKKLNSLLTDAKPDLTGSSSYCQGSIDKEESFQRLVVNWSSASKDLLDSLGEFENSIVKSKGSRSLLALGAMEAHIKMALQALKASEKED
ncbi:MULTISPECIES: hypothetical protein [unclassified Prochlorococcus]|uniref:hypothetical protein n=1 Tax=unclassified Prochlorococcus TaxID=2627481 RepID=UPI000533B320|nr:MULTISPECIES: hypothetical protein [unclassified Prochlorococcus]KGG18069.1 putative MATH domain [Prochlorococcus sp. MIT 0602]